MRFLSQLNAGIRTIEKQSFKEIIDRPLTNDHLRPTPPLFVCEQVYLPLVGAVPPFGLMEKNAGRGRAPPRGWRMARQEIIDGITPAMKDFEKEMEATLRENDLKDDSCVEYIQQIMERYSDDSPLPGLEGVKIVPFHTIAQLYGLYCLDCSDDNRPKEEVASAETFRQAFREMEESKLVKLLSCKDAFCTCLVCNVLDEMLMNSSKQEK